jgi:phosphoribosyl 1,2-cyclic phosphodiesterase
MRVQLCGVRGSTPTSGAAFRAVGGHTSCVAVAHDGREPSLVLDAGSGIREVTPLLLGQPFSGSIVLSHLHWDHMMGLPFFAGADRPGSLVELLVPSQAESAFDLLSRAMSPPLFPIGPLKLRGEWQFGGYEESTFERDGFVITAREVPHSAGRTMGLRVSDGTRTLAYLPDHAPHLIGLGHHGVGELHPAAIELAMGVDLLIHDAQYTRSELGERFLWGHAAADYSAELAAHCGVGQLLMFHHDPSRTDVAVAELRDQIAIDGGVPISVAVEGAVYHL